MKVNSFSGHSKEKETECPFSVFESEKFYLNRFVLIQYCSSMHRSFTSLSGTLELNMSLRYLILSTDLYICLLRHTIVLSYYKSVTIDNNANYSEYSNRFF